MLNSIVICVVRSLWVLNYHFHVSNSWVLAFGSYTFFGWQNGFCFELNELRMSRWEFKGLISSAVVTGWYDLESPQEYFSTTDFIKKLIWMSSNNFLQTDVLVDCLLELLEHFSSNVGVFQTLALVIKDLSIYEFSQGLASLTCFLNLHDTSLSLSYKSL